jgi:signal transduction histidine kinase/ActR/RegA family two-component response regulator/putative methionine-R-sulfoxide reductase with GAF domain
MGESSPVEMTAELKALRRERGMLTEQLDAVTEVLAAVGRHAADPEQVLTSLVETASSLCEADACTLYLFEGEYFRVATTAGMTPEFIAYNDAHPMPMDRNTLTGRVALDRSPQQIDDVLADPDYGRRDLQQVGGYRSVIAAPLVLDDAVVGVLNLWRFEVRPFRRRELDLVSGFAGAAAMAVNGVRLVRQLESRSNELAVKVEELEALRDVGEAVGSSLDIDSVLASIARHAVELSDTDGGSIMGYSEIDQRFVVRSTYRTAPDVVERLSSTIIRLDETLVGRSATTRQPIAVSDMRDAPLDPHLEVLLADGWLSLAAIPMLREDRIVGALIVRRRRPGPFAPETLETLAAFASQSALALVNAQLYRALEEQSRELEEASRHKSEFLASMSHELRTPLNAVLGFSEVLLERMFGDLNERQEEYLRDIHGSGRHLLELLNDILDLSKVEAGRMELSYTVLDVRTLLDDAASMVREGAETGGLSLEVDVTDEPAVYADELRVRQVLLNLMANAVKFTPAGGSVTVRAHRVGDRVAIEVADTGVGIPPEDQERIFESFQQGGRGPSREEGTGLGLTLSRRLIELHGGMLTVASEVGVGSEFRFTLPAQVDEAAATSVRAEGGGRVVVIEDDRPSADLFTAYLRSASLEVISARDGPTGLAAVRDARPDAVLLDIRLPGIDGWTVLTTLKEDPVTAPIPVIIVSIVDEKTRGAVLGAAGYLVKPVGRDQLLRALAQAGLTVERSAT